MVLLSGCLPAFGRAVRSGPFFRRGSRLRRLRWPYLPQAISRCSCSGRWHSYLRADGMEIGVDRAELYGSDFYGRLVCCRRTEPMGLGTVGASDAATFLAVSGMNPLWIVLFVFGLALAMTACVRDTMAQTSVR